MQQPREGRKVCEAMRPMHTAVKDACVIIMIIVPKMTSGPALIQFWSFVFTVGSFSCSWVSRYSGGSLAMQVSQASYHVLLVP